MRLECRISIVHERCIVLLILWFFLQIYLWSNSNAFLHFTFIGVRTILKNDPPLREALYSLSFEFFFNFALFAHATPIAATVKSLYPLPIVVILPSGFYPMNPVIAIITSGSNPFVSSEDGNNLASPKLETLIIPYSHHASKAVTGMLNKLFASCCLFATINNSNRVLLRDGNNYYFWNIPITKIQVEGRSSRKYVRLRRRKKW